MGEVTVGIKIVKQSLIFFKKGNRSKCIFLSMVLEEEDCSH